MKKIFSILALLLMTAMGATAQTMYNVMYTVTVKDGTEDAAKWSADPNPAWERHSVTIKYNGTKKIKSVTAAMAALRPLAEATTADLGKVGGADGIIYGTKAAAEAAATQAVAMIAYVGSETDHDTYKHGLAIALDEEGSKMNWYKAIGACLAKNASTPFLSASASWMLPSQNQWLKAFGHNDASWAGLQIALANAGGDSSKLQELEDYWSSTPCDGSTAMDVGIRESGDAHWYRRNMDDEYRVRACLAF